MTPEWLITVCNLLEHEPAIVRVTVAQTRGSIPRESGTTMLVSAARQWGTIGGGQLEWQAVEQARRMLADAAGPGVRIERLRLGPDLAQCCGGEVSLWHERLVTQERPALRALCATLSDGAPDTHLRTLLRGNAVHREAMRMEPALRPAVRTALNAATGELVEWQAAPAQPLWIFGAGHVGQAVLKLVRALPMFTVTCIDSRPDIFPDARRDAGVDVALASEPVEHMASAPPGCCFLVLTHDHELDYQLCAAILARGDAAWLGLIGSASKAARFRSRLRRAGFDAQAIAQLVSPVGLVAIRSKLPAAIAISIVAQLLERMSTPAATVSGPAVLKTFKVPAVTTDCDPACGRCAERRPA